MGILAPHPTQRELPLSNWTGFRTRPFTASEQDVVDGFLGPHERAPNRALRDAEPRQVRTGHLDRAGLRADDQLIAAQGEGHASLPRWLAVWPKRVKKRCAAAHRPSPSGSSGRSLTRPEETGTLWRRRVSPSFWRSIASSTL